jgi:hypothetical protein
VLGLDNAANEHPAVHAGVVHHYAVVMVAGLRYSVGVHKSSFLLD